ncbi:MAG: tRNA pseudouridine(55) synthase TruB [Firmicutes bacterium]|nr:tRNA pseudouridine(55) synthase TruB [Bacillota bacterium]
MKDGILIIDKPQNWTSHDCVAVARKALGVEKLGHGGTLDPMACGLLPLFIGRATRIMEYLDMDDKTYDCTVKLGITTDTQDVWGAVLKERSPSGITPSDFERALLSFEGHQKQLPPKYSAVRIDGKRLYEYARDGEEVEVKPRDVFIKDVQVTDFDEETKEGRFLITVSKGTYIRTICNDLGEKLGCGAAMSGLKRTKVGIFTLDNATTPERLKELMNQSKELKEDYRVPEDILQAIMPVDVPMVNLGRVSMSLDRAYYFVAGNSIRWRQVKVIEKPHGSSEVKNRRGRAYDVLYRVYAEDGRFIGTGYYDSKTRELKADKIFMKRQEL